MKRQASRNVVARAFVVSALLASMASLSHAQTIATPDGYAGYAGTTGGGNASPITVSTAAAFQSAVNNNNPAVIIVNGMLNVGTVSIGSNKTIVGANTNSGLYGGVVQVRGSNYIFQNLNFGPSGSDAMEVSGASKVFIHKCSFRDSSDELCSIVRQADFVTISWSKFHFDNPDSHSFGHLIGNSDSATADRGKLHVTLHHNWYGPGLRGRIPRVRFGHVHMYNNYINAVGTGYCIGIGVECNIRVENTHFDGVNNCWANYGGSSNGRIGWAGLKFTNGSTQPTFMPNTFPVFTPPYSFSLDPVDNVRALVLAGAGNVFGGGGNNAPSVSITAPPNGASFTAPANITVNASAADSDGTISSVAFYQGSTLLGTDTTAPYSFTWNNVPAGTYSLTARATDNAGATTTSSAVSVTVNPASNNPPSVSIASPASGASFTAPASITINANATDSDGTISSVAFYQGSTLLGTDTTAPYSFTWNNVAAGNYSLTARATDNGGAVTTSAAVSVSVTSGGGGGSTLQAESASFGGGVTIDSNNAGFNGTGFANFPATGGFVQFSNVNGGTGGAATLAIRHALGATTARPGRLLINGVAQNITFNPTGSWTTWTTLTLNITLTSGTGNTIRFESNGQDLANLDEITVTPSAGGGNTPPTVSITAPANDASFTAPASITISANASDSDGTIASVAFYQGSTLLSTDTTAPYSFTWNNVVAGNYSLTVRATDNGGAVTTSAAVSVSVTSGGGGVPTPLIRLGFNENSGTSVANSGSVAATFTKTTPPAWSTNVPAGGGASSIDFGTTAGNSYVESSAILSPLAGLTSFTVTGWVNNRSSTQGAGGNRIVSWIRNGGNGVDIVYRSTGALQVGINQWPDSSVAISNAGRIPTNSSAPASNWTFFAVTYDAASSTLQFYFGSDSATATLDKTVTYNRGAVGTNIGKLAIGHFNAESSRTSRTDRMFRGLIDQVAIHGSVLTLAQIQAVQTGSTP